MWWLALSIALAADPVAALVSGDVDAGLRVIERRGFDSVDEAIRAMPRRTMLTNKGSWWVVQPHLEDVQESAFDTHIVRTPDGITHLLWSYGSITHEPDHLGNSRRWAYELHWSQDHGQGWGDVQSLGRTKFEMIPFVDRAGTLHLFSNAYNQEPSPDEHGLAPGHYDVHWSQLIDGAFTPWRDVLPETPRILHGFDVAEDASGTLWFAWSPWGGPNNSPQTLKLRRLGDTLGEVRTLDHMSERNLTYPRFDQESDGSLALFASAQTFDNRHVNVAHVPLDHRPATLFEQSAHGFLTDHRVAGAPPGLIWREATKDRLVLHIGEHALELPPSAESLGLARIAVRGDLVALGYDSGVYLLKRDGKGWSAAVLQEPVRGTKASPIFPNGVTLQVVDKQVIVAWWHPEKGLLTWTGPQTAATHSWPEVTWQTSPGLGLGSGAKAWLGTALMNRADKVESLDPERAQCLRDIVAVGLRDLGGPGYRPGGPPDQVPTHCFDRAHSSPRDEDIPSPGRRPSRR